MEGRVDGLGFAAAGWFGNLGDALEEEARADVLGMLPLHGLAEDSSVATAASWLEAWRAWQASERDDRWWDREEAERERLWDRVSGMLGEDELATRLANLDASLGPAVRGAVANALAKSGFGDVELERAAVGAALLAAQQATLAALAAERDLHYFRCKCRLFIRGRWPIGVDRDRFVVF